MAFFSMLRQLITGNMTEAVDEMDSESDEDGIEYDEMVQPSLIKQLKSILREYRDDGQILKELIQNAEDAEATEMKILYDNRQVNTEIVNERKRPFKKYFKGPALVVYNDAMFTEKDWKGIKMLYTSIKEDDPLKVGRFGLGFKSVFHITDYPVIVSGKKLLILNPHMTNPRKVCQTINFETIHKCKGMQISDCLDALSGVFGFNQTTLDKGYSGTLFRFPLRNQVTELSDNIYDESKVNDLIKSFQVEASVSLLFLKSLERVEVFQHVGHNEDLLSQQLSFAVQISGSNISKVRSEKRKFLSWMKTRNPDKGDGKSCCFEVAIKTEKLVGDSFQEDEHKWFIYNYFKDSKVSEKFGALCRDQSLGYCPYVGVAVPMTTNKDFQGHIFCFLPLPLDAENFTGLPVHVNGFFALDQNRRHLKWATDDQLQNQSHRDKQILWNEHLISEALSDAYLLAIKELIEISEGMGNPDNLVSTVLQCIPNISSKKWSLLFKPLFENLLDEPFLFTRNNEGQWISLEDAVFDVFRKHSYDDVAVSCQDKVRESVLKLLVHCEENVVQVSADLWSTLKGLKPSAQCITPGYIRGLLKITSKYKRMSFKERVDILQFALLDEGYGDLVGLKLLPLQDKTFTSFEMDDFSNDTIYTCTEREIMMFPGLEHRFVSTDIPSDVQTHIHNMSMEGTGLFQLGRIRLNCFERLLTKTLDINFSKSQSPPIWNPSCPKVGEAWLAEIWKYIRNLSPRSLQMFQSLPIIPVKIKSGYYLHTLSSCLILKSFSGFRDLPDEVCECLQYLSAVIVPVLPHYVLDHQVVMSEYVSYPNTEGIFKMLSKLGKNSSNFGDKITKFNESSSISERKDFVQCLGNAHQSYFTESANLILSRLQLFIQTSKSGMASVIELKEIAPLEKIPVDLPRNMLYCPNQHERQLAMYLGAQEVGEKLQL